MLEHENMPESVQMIKTEGSMKRLQGCWAVLAMAVAAAVGLIDPGPRHGEGNRKAGRRNRKSRRLPAPADQYMES